MFLKHSFLFSIKKDKPILRFSKQIEKNLGQIEKRE